MPTGVYKRTKPVWNKGRKMPLEERSRLSETMKARGIQPTVRYVPPTGVAHPLWKGDDVGYSGLHYWVSRHKGKPEMCEFCGKTEGRFEWANKSRLYKRDLEDWLSLCYSCHDIYDEVHSKRK